MYGSFSGRPPVTEQVPPRVLGPGHPPLCMKVATSTRPRFDWRNDPVFLAKQPDMHARHAASLAWLFVFEPGFSLVGSAIKLTPCCLPASDGGFIPFGQGVWESANANSLELFWQPPPSDVLE